MENGNIDSSNLSELHPSVLNIELTNACNLNCIFCDHHILKESMAIKELDCSLLKKILDDVSGVHTFELGLVGLGEPLLNKSFHKHLKIINEYKDKFNRISLNTNAVSLNLEKAEKICRSAINYMTVSLNAADRETYLKLMGKDHYERVLKNIKMFLEIRRKYERDDLKVCVQVMHLEMNDKTVLKNELSGYLDKDVFVFARDLYNKPVLDNTNVFKIDLKETERRCPCWSIFSRIYVDVNGYFYPCTIGNDCYRESSNLMIGNVKEKSILDLFNSDYLIQARERAVRSRLSFSECSRCNIWSLLPNNFEWDNSRNIWTNKKQEVRLKQYDLASSR